MRTSSSILTLNPAKIKDKSVHEWEKFVFVPLFLDTVTTLSANVSTILSILTCLFSNFILFILFGYTILLLSPNIL